MQKTSYGRYGYTKKQQKLKIHPLRVQMMECASCFLEKPFYDFIKVGKHNGDMNNVCYECFDDIMLCNHGVKNASGRVVVDEILSEEIRKIRERDKRKGYVKISNVCLENDQIANTLRGKVRAWVLRGSNDKECEEIVGCTRDQFKEHIESQFYYDMSWDNHGKYTWHFEHIYPCAGFDLRLEHEIKRCFNWSNYRPMAAEDNMGKNAIVFLGQKKPSALPYPKTKPSA